MAGASMNQCNFIGRLTRDPEQRTFQGGGSVVTFGYAFTGQSRKNQQTGSWEDEPCYVDVKCFISGDGKGKGKTVMDWCKKGTQIRVTGRLVLEQWDDKNGGGKRSRHVIYLDELTLLGSRDDNGGQGARSGGGQQGGGQRSGGGNQRRQAHQGADGVNADNYEYGGAPAPQEDADIPF